MSDALFRLLGIRAAEGSEWERSSLHFTNLTKPFQYLVFLLAAAAGCYAIWWFYRREPAYCTPARKRIMAACRMLGFFVLLFILTGPVLEVYLRTQVKGKVVVLVDTSKSMSRVDKYKRPEDKLIAAHVLGHVPLSDGDPNKISSTATAAIETSDRMTLTRGLLDHKDIRLLERIREQYNLEVWSFSKVEEMRRLDTDKGPVDSSILKDIEANGMVTEIGGAIRKTVSTFQGQDLSGIVLLTDGGNNKGEEPAVVAQEFGVRVFPIGIGVPESQDVAVSHVFMESKIFVDDIAPIHVRVKQHGFTGDQARLSVTCDGAELARMNITLKEGEQTEILRVKPKEKGQFIYKVEVQPLSSANEDAEPANNFKSRPVEVVDQKLKVLMIEMEPRWEFRYLKNALLRDKRADVKILLRVPDMEQLAESDPAYLKDFPEDLAESYHVVVFGNMPNDGFLNETHMDQLRDFVLKQGGGIWFIAGKNNFPDTYKDSKLELLIPVEFERAAEITAEDEQQNALIEPYRVALTPEGRGHSVTRLETVGENNEEQNAALWDLVPEMYWHHRAIRAKLGASTLLALGSDKNSRGAPEPLMVVSQVGRGRVLYQAFSDLWRMRYPAELGPDALERFHGHVIQYLGLPKLMGGTESGEISTEREEYGIGEKVKISARIHTKMSSGAAIDMRSLTVNVTEDGTDAPMGTVTLSAESGQEGLFRGEFEPKEVGRMKFTVDGTAISSTINVIIPQVELDNPDMKKDLLESVAKASARSAPDTGSKVRMYFADQAGDLVKDITQAQRVTEERRENTLWDSPLLVILFTLFMGIEWFLRKRSDLL